MFLISPKSSMPWLIGLTLLVNFSLQILSLTFSPYEVPVLGGLLYLVNGILLFLVAAHVLWKGNTQRNPQFLQMGTGMTFLATTYLVIGAGLFEFFGVIEPVLVNAGMFMVIVGNGLAALFLMLAPATGRLRSGYHKVLITMFLLVIFIVGVYQLRSFLPMLYTPDGLPTLLRQQLITIVLILYALAAVRFALSEWGKSPQYSVQWYLIGIMVLTLVMLNFMLSAAPGDGFSWAARFFQLLASGAFIQYQWWDQRGE